MLRQNSHPEDMSGRPGAANYTLDDADLWQPWRGHVRCTVWDPVSLAWVAASASGGSIGGGTGTSSGFPVGQYTSMTLTGDATHDVVTYSNGKVKTITYTDSTKSAVSSVVLT